MAPPLGGGTAAALKLRVERVGAVRPERAIALEPVVELGERSRIERIQPALTVTADAHEPVLAQNPQVARDPRPARVELGRKLTCAPLPLGEELDDAEPRWVGERVRGPHRATSSGNRRSARVHQPMEAIPRGAAMPRWSRTRTVPPSPSRSSKRTTAAGSSAECQS